jgi:hypothetical protein
LCRTQTLCHECSIATPAMSASAGSRHAALRNTWLSVDAAVSGSVGEDTTSWQPAPLTQEVRVSATSDKPSRVRNVTVRAEPVTLSVSNDVLAHVIHSAIQSQRSATQSGNPPVLTSETLACADGA